MWRMVYEDQKTGNRWFVMGNSNKGFPDSKMAKIVLNTVEKGQRRSFDLVERAGVTLKAATTDVHSNLIDKRGLDDLGNIDFDFPEISLT